MKGISFNTAQTAQPLARALERSVSAANKSIERLSTGMRINQASDDAAGLSISMNLRANVRVFNQGVRNLNDGISTLNIADGALSQLNSIITREKELAEQSANGVYSDKQRQAMQNEANQLVKEFNRIIETTEMNGIKLLQDPAGSLELQGGYGDQAVLDASFAADAARNVGDGGCRQTLDVTGSGNAFGGVVADFNADGNMDIARTRFGAVQVRLGNGDGTFQAAQNSSTDAASTGYQLAAGDLNNDGAEDIVTANITGSTVSVLLGKQDGTFAVKSVLANGSGGTRSVSLGDLNNDGNIDIVASNLDTPELGVFMGNGDGSFQNRSIYAVDEGSFDTELFDYDGDGDLDIANGKRGEILRNDGSGNFSLGPQVFAGVSSLVEIKAADLNGDQKKDLIASNAFGSFVYAVNNGDGTFTNPTIISLGSNLRGLDVGDLNDDGNVDVAVTDVTESKVFTLLGNGDGTFQTAKSINASGDARSVKIADFNNDFISDIFVESFTFPPGRAEVIFQSTVLTNKQGPLDLTTQESSRRMLDKLEIDTQRITRGLGAIGAMQARLTVAINTLNSAKENFAAADSRISEADVGEESAKLLRENILQQAGASLLAKAQTPARIALELLKEA